MLRQRARRYREEEAQTRQQALQKETFAATAPKASLLDPGYAVGQPRVPANIFETLWFAAPLKVRLLTWSQHHADAIYTMRLLT